MKVFRKKLRHAIFKDIFVFRMLDLSVFEKYLPMCLSLHDEHFMVNVIQLSEFHKILHLVAP